MTGGGLDQKLKSLQINNIRKQKTHTHGCRDYQTPRMYMHTRSQTNKQQCCVHVRLHGVNLMWQRDKKYKYLRMILLSAILRFYQCIILLFCWVFTVCHTAFLKTAGLNRGYVQTNEGFYSHPHWRPYMCTSHQKITGSSMQSQEWQSLMETGSLTSRPLAYFLNLYHDMGRFIPEVALNHTHTT